MASTIASYILVTMNPKDSYKYRGICTLALSLSALVSTTLRSHVRLKSTLAREHDLSSVDIDVYSWMGDAIMTREAFKEVIDAIVDDDEFYDVAFPVGKNATFGSVNKADSYKKLETTSKGVRRVQFLVVVHLPEAPNEANPITKKRISLSRENVIETARDCSIPSAGSHNKFFILMQHPDQPNALFNGRPLSLSPTPSGIYESTFARFKENMRNPIEQYNLTSRELQEAKKYIATVSDLCHNEVLCRDTLNAQEIMGMHNFWASSDVMVNEHGRNAYIQLVGTRTFLLHEIRTVVHTMIGELEFNLSKGYWDVLMRAQFNYMKIVSSDNYHRLRPLSCCPAFIVGQVGTIFTVWSAVLADRFFFEPLANIYLGPWQGGVGDKSGFGESIYKFAAVLRNLHIGQEELVKHYTSLFIDPASSAPVPGSIGPIRTSTSRRFAALSPITQKSSSNRGAASDAPSQSGDRPEIGITDATRASSHTQNKTTPCRGQNPSWRRFEAGFSGTKHEYEIEYGCRLSPFFDKPVFRATMTSTGDFENRSTDVVVKFACEYGKEGHEILARAGLAPKLYFAEYITPQYGPGMWAVVMQYIQGEAFDCRKASDVQRNKLKHAISLLHDQDYVYGDLGGRNILIGKDDNLHVIDFDWCGKLGKARYPADVNTEEEMHWHQDVQSGVLIAKEHDLHRLDLLESFPL